MGVRRSDEHSVSGAPRRGTVLVLPRANAEVLGYGGKTAAAAPWAHRRANHDSPYDKPNPLIRMRWRRVQRTALKGVEAANDAQYTRRSLRNERLSRICTIKSSYEVVAVNHPSPHRQ